MLLNCGVGEDSWESLGLQKTKPVNPVGNQSWLFIGRTDAEAEATILWPSDAKNWVTGKEPDAGKDWRWEDKQMTVDEMVGWHHWLDGHEFEQAPGVGDGKGSLVCCSSWGLKESYTTEDSTELNNLSGKRIVNIYIYYIYIYIYVYLNHFAVYLNPTQHC